MKLRAAVVGCGALANGTHLQTICNSDNFQLKAVCDIYEAKAREAAEKWGAERFCTDWHEIVDADDVDLVVLCTHLNLRSELIVAALKAGKPVYTEKPMAASREETMKILMAADATKVPVCVGHNRRSNPPVIEFKRLIDLAREKGADRAAIIDRTSGLRELVAEESQTQVLIRVNDDVRTWKYWIFQDEHGIMFAEMTHFIDLAMWWMASPPVEVYCSGSTRGNFTQIIRFADGSAATLLHSMVGNFDYPKELFEASLRNVTIGLEHHLTLRQRGLESEPQCQFFPLAPGGAELTDKPGLEGFYDATEKMQQLKLQGKPLPTMIAGPPKGHENHLERFRLHIIGEGENPCTAAEAAAVTNVAFKLLESARSGLPVKILPEDYDFPRGDWEEMSKRWD